MVINLEIDKNGSITLPPTIIEALGLCSQKGVIIELTKEGALLKKNKTVSITEEIASMNLPVSDWEDMEKEINAGQLK